MIACNSATSATYYWPVPISEQSWGLPSKNQAESLLKKAEDLRNRLAHSQQDLVEGSSWQALIELIEKLEALVHRSDDAVEQDAKSASKSVDSLWVAR